MGKARLERQSGDCAAMGGSPAIVVDCLDGCETPARLVERRSGRRIEEGETARVGLAPEQRRQKQARQVRFEDFRWVMRR
jgi:hypothetical protein